MQPYSSSHGPILSPPAKGFWEEGITSLRPRFEARVSDTRRITIGSVCREPMVGANREALRAKKPGRQFSLELSLSAQRKGKT